MTYNWLFIASGAARSLLASRSRSSPSRSFSQATEAIRKLIKQGNDKAPPPSPLSPLTAQVLANSPNAFSHHPHVTLSKGRIRLAKALQIILPISGISLLVYAFSHPDSEPLVPTRMPAELQYLAAQQIENQDVIVNWSNTHSAKPKRFFLPETEAEVESFVRAAHDSGQKLRVVGSALSPNGLALSDEEGMLGMALLDKIISVDVEKKRVTVQAGARVQQVADALKPYGLTLENYASIRDQQVGGFTQVGAHGTGASIPPVDEQVVAMRLVTPAMGTVTLSKEDEPELFNLAKVGLGALGVVTRLELQCVARHQLVEETFVCSTAEVGKNHVKWLRENKHLKYLWLPYTDSVVVIRCNPVTLNPKPSSGKTMDPNLSFSTAQRVQPLKALYLQRVGSSLDAASKREVDAITSATELRDRLLALDPLDKNWIVQVNKAEEEYWKMSCGSRVGYSDEILGFDCGGQQCVLEAAFPVAESIDKIPGGGKSKDLEYVRTLLREIERSKIPAPSPIEQRWTSGSSSALSPAVGSPSSVHCWVGAIMYLPQHDSSVGEEGETSSKREKVLNAFKSYSEVIQEKVMPKFNATWHWAKLELPRSAADDQVDELKMERIRKRLGAKFPVDLFNAYRSMLDPKNILANPWIDSVIPRRP